MASEIAILAALLVDTIQAGGPHTFDESSKEHDLWVRLLEQQGRMA